MYLLVCDASDCDNTVEVSGVYHDNIKWFKLEYNKDIDPEELEEDEYTDTRVVKHLCSTTCVANMAEEIYASQDS